MYFQSIQHFNTNWCIFFIRILFLFDFASLKKSTKQTKKQNIYFSNSLLQCRFFSVPIFNLLPLWHNKEKEGKKTLSYLKQGLLLASVLYASMRAQLGIFANQLLTTSGPVCTGYTSLLQGDFLIDSSIEKDIL